MKILRLTLEKGGGDVTCCGTVTIQSFTCGQGSMINLVRNRSHKYFCRVALYLDGRVAVFVLVAQDIADLRYLRWLL